MTTHRLEVADVFRKHGAEFLSSNDHRLVSVQRRALRDLAACRTRALGGHVEACTQCGHRRISYNSCRNRHCPKCQGSARARWLSERAKELLPARYFHVVFTIPDNVAALALGNPRLVYGLLFEAAAKTLLSVAADPKHLGAQIGCMGVLHTWGQNLMHHPHVHFIVSGGGLSLDGKRWIASRRKFLLPVRVLSRVFRGKFIALLRSARTQGKLSFGGSLQSLTHDATFESWLNEAVRQDWVVYAKPPFGGPAQVLKYLARYTHRVAISNDRLIDLKDGHVRFRWKDYGHDGKMSVMTMPAMEFIRRFLQHVLPQGFVKIRHYGFLANKNRQVRLAHIRSLLLPTARNPPASPPTITPFAPIPTATDECPACHRGKMCLLETLESASFPERMKMIFDPAKGWDSS